MTISCQICQASAHGVHFGVVSCRACAVFFRRTIVRNRQDKYNCKNRREDCEFRSDGRHHCQFCRFQKCLSVGMTTLNVQFLRDSRLSITGTLARRIISNPSDNSDVASTSKGVVDASFIKQKVMKVLNDTALHKSPRFMKMNKLAQAEFALNKWRSFQRTEKSMRVLKKCKIMELWGIYQQQMLIVAEWLAHSTDFQSLEQEEKFQFFKLIWNIWRRFERYEMSLSLFGIETVEEDKFAITDQHIFTRDTLLDFSEVTNIPNERMRECFRDTWFQLFHQSSKSLLELKPTSIEMAFMLSELSWQIAGKAMQGRVLEISEQVRDELGNNLHEYFIKKEPSNKYAGRLIKLTKIVNTIIKSHQELKNNMELAMMFGVFNKELSEPDLIDH
ncbi:unnamed protein product [Caenorhabditis brenneri]